MGSISEDTIFKARVMKYGNKKLSQKVDMHPNTLYQKCSGLVNWQEGEKAKVEAVLSEAGL